MSQIVVTVKTTGTLLPINTHQDLCSEARQGAESSGFSRAVVSRRMVQLYSGNILAEEVRKLEYGGGGRSDRVGVIAPSEAMAITLRGNAYYSIVC